MSSLLLPLSPARAQPGGDDGVAEGPLRDLRLCRRRAAGQPGLPLPLSRARPPAGRLTRLYPFTFSQARPEICLPRPLTSVFIWLGSESMQPAGRPGLPLPLIPTRQRALGPALLTGGRRRHGSSSGRRRGLGPAGRACLGLVRPPAAGSVRGYQRDIAVWRGAVVDDKCPPQ